MNRTELREAVATQTGLSGAQADQALTAVLDAITAALAKGEKVTLPGFGTFETRARSAREGRNPQTGETIQIAASVQPAFKAGAGLKKAVSGS
ncbi:HU family DNA-binding protein [Nocardioides sp.]|uniref:HU family DNA-binding protein n=1 Tax=Nocardioides sp. TaxID=35761 RepID=UPI003510F870